MFTTATEVKTITGKIVDAALVARAQYVIEAYIGKFESDITESNDEEILKRAVAYQAAYMLNNEDIVYEQMAVSTTGQSDSYTTFKQGDNVSPFIAPLAVMICNKLSFIRSRSIYTGKFGDTSIELDWRTV
jgi:hypothetical protein